MRLRLSWIAVILLLASTAHAQNHRLAIELPVRIFDQTDQQDDQRRVSLETAAAVLATAGVRIVWTVCPLAANLNSECLAPLGETERVIRVMATSPTWSRQECVSMGDSIVDGSSRPGVLASVYADRVAWIASRAGINNGVLLGRAIAHELGHLLLGARHSSTGIMRRCWTVSDLRWDRPGDWQFTRDQVAALGLRRQLP